MINIKKFNEILEGWKNLIIKDDSVEEIAQKRIEICVDCKQFTERNICDVCGCYMPAKVRSLTSNCDLKKW